MFPHSPWSLLPTILSGRWLGMTIVFAESTLRLKELSDLSKDTERR